MKQQEDEIEKFIRDFCPDKRNEIQTPKVQLVKAVRSEFNMDLRSTLLLIKKVL